MKILRKYLLKATIVSFVCAGLLTAFCQPVEGEQPNPDLADWLQANTNITLTPQKAQQLSQLSRYNIDINSLFKQAGEIIFGHNGQTSIPENISLASFHQYLMMKWSMFNLGQQMNAVTNISIKFEEEMLTMKKPLAITGINEMLLKRDTNEPVHFQEDAPSLNLNNHIVPLVNEISIGAP